MGNLHFIVYSRGRPNSVNSAHLALKDFALQSLILVSQALPLARRLAVASLIRTGKEQLIQTRANTMLFYSKNEKNLEGIE